MDEKKENGSKRSVDLKDAALFWEPRRVWYNVALLVIVALWLVFTWPHFHPAMNWVALGKMTVLGLLANLCYCVGYVAEGFIQPLFPQQFWKRARWAVWTAGMLLAILLSNYWIADEIYPDVQQNTANAVISGNVSGGATIASNMNFPAPLAVVGFLVGCVGLFLAVAAVVIFWLARKRRFARYALRTTGIGIITYFALLFSFSAGSRATALAPGQEKYFCEIDCHLAYSVVNVATKTDGNMNDYVVTMRTRFDETTISPQRPKDAPLMPSPREVTMIDGTGNSYAPVATSGTSLTTPLKPAESYNTQLEFRIPKNASGLRLLLNTIPQWPDRLVIGDENSLGHKKTYFAL